MAAHLRVDDQTLAALADARRRAILLALAGRDRTDPLHAPAAVDAGELDAEALRIALHHRHLPKLQAAGLIAWDREGLTVSRGPAFEDALAVLRALEEDRPAPELPA